MSTHKPKPIEEFVQQIQEALEQIQQIQEALEEKPDRDDVEHWSSELAVQAGGDPRGRERSAG